MVSAFIMHKIEGRFKLANYQCKYNQYREKARWLINELKAYLNLGGMHIYKIINSSKEEKLNDLYVVNE